jgi:signal transduction histidine kinase
MSMGEVLSGNVPGINDGEVHILRPDGSRVIVIVNIAPLKNDRGVIAGAINCFYDVTHRKQAEEHLRLLKDQLEERVVERTQELTESQSRLRALAAELNVTEQRERKRLATDLHDYLGQLLALSKIRLSHASQMAMDPGLAKIISDLQDTTERALSYTRTLISQLTPPDLADFSLPIALRWLTTQMVQHDLLVSLRIENKIPALPEEQALLLFQSIRELLLNCVKHANTHEATVTLGHASDSLHIQVSDRGAGFDAEAQGSRGVSGHAFGLFSIRERMLSLGGRVELVSSPGTGTTATLVLPLIS